MFQSSGPARIRSMRNIIFKTRVEAELALIQVKTTILSGAHDSAVYMKNLTEYTFSEKVTLRHFQDGHHLPMTRPELITGVVQGM